MTYAGSANEASWGWYWVWQCCGSPLPPDSRAGTWRYCSGSFGYDKIGECRRFPSDDMGQSYERKHVKMLQKGWNFNSWWTVWTLQYWLMVRLVRMMNKYLDVMHRKINQYQLINPVKLHMRLVKCSSPGKLAFLVFKCFQRCLRTRPEAMCSAVSWFNFLANECVAVLEAFGLNLGISSSAPCPSPAGAGGDDPRYPRA